MQYERPPRLGRFLVRLQPLGARRGEIESDLLELFEQRADARGRRYAAWRYCLDALSLWRTWTCAPRPSMDPVALGRGLSGVAQDVMFATRLFRREPTPFAVTVAGLALAIGVSTAMFTLANAVALRGVGVEAPESIFEITLRAAGNPAAPWTFGDFDQLRRSLPQAGLTGELRIGFPAPSYEESQDAGRAEYISTAFVSGNYFSVLGAHTSLGRVLTEADDLPGAAPVVVMSHMFWKTRFASARSVVGRTVRFGGESFTIVGVAARGFTGPIDSGVAPAFWMPMTAVFALKERDSKTSGFNRHTQYVNVYGRVAPNAPLAQIEAQASTIAAAGAAARGVPAPARPTAHPSPIDRVRSQDDKWFVVAIVMAIVGLTLFVGCANVANVLLASATARRREIGTRLALGATRTRVVRQLLTESVLLALMGGAVGFLVAAWLVPVFASLLDAPTLLDLSPDGSVYLFAAGVAILAGLGAGLAPARYGRRGDLRSAIAADSHAAGAAMPSSRVRSLLIAGQAAASLVLVVVTALFVRGFLHASSLELGLKPDRLLTASVGLGRDYRGPRATEYWAASLEQIRQLPGVSSAALVSIPPFIGVIAPQPIPNSPRHTLGMYLRGVPMSTVYRNETSADYFAAVDARVLRGRTYTDEEMRAGARVAVITASLAHHFWGSADPIGDNLSRVWGDEDTPNARDAGLLRKPIGTRIIGVVSDTVTGLATQEAPTIYLPLSVTSLQHAYVLIKADIDPEPMVRPVRDVLRSSDAELRPTMTLVRDSHQKELGRPKSLATLASIIGGTSLALAVIGLFGVTAFVVGQRRHEVGVRIALGASYGDILAMILRDALRPVMAGMMVGLFLSLVAGHVLRGALYGISGRDPIAMVAGSLVLLLAALAATLGPASESARVDPAEMLKQS